MSVDKQISASDDLILSTTSQAPSMPDELTLKALAKMDIHLTAIRQLAAGLVATRGREDLIKYLQSEYNAPQRLERQHRDLIKIIKSLEAGYDGSEAVCQLACKQRRSIKELQIHHPDYITNHNQLDELRVACLTDNDADAKRHQAKQRAAKRVTELREGKRELGGAGVAGAGTDDDLTSIPASSLESAKHRIMRPRYDRWVRNIVNGPFSQQVSWNPRKLAEAAAYGCGENGKVLGSSKTYYKYVREDVAGGILLLDDNIESSIFGINVRLNRELLEKIRGESGE